MANQFTTVEAMAYLNLSRGTFFNRIKEFHIQAVNFNPGLRKQHKPMWNINDLDKIKYAAIRQPQGV